MRISKIGNTRLINRTHKKVAAYARVSTETESLAHSLSAQISYYSKLIQCNPEWEYVGVYADSFISGTKANNRAELQRLINDCEAGQIDIVLTKSISRFARNTVDLLRIVRHLKELNISVRFEKEKIDSLTSDGELMLTILAGFAEEESKSISSNLKWSFQKRFKRGEQWHNAAFGYRWNGKTFIIQEDEASIVRKIYDDYLNDVSITSIWKWVKANGFPGICRNTIKYILQNEVYKGDVLLQKYYSPNPLQHRTVRNNGVLPAYYVENNHDPIIKKEVWQAVQEKYQDELEKNPVVRNTRHSCFSGKIICCRCGYKYCKEIMRPNKTDGIVENWLCYGKKINGKTSCPSKSIRDDRLRIAAAQAMGIKEFDEEVFTQRVKFIMTTEGEELEFYFYNGRIKKIPIRLFRPGHDAHMPFPGYTWSLGKYVVVPKEAEIVRLVYNLYAEGLTITDIRKKVMAAGYTSSRGKVSHRYIARMLDDDRYSGRRVEDGVVIENAHETIIDQNLYNQVRELRDISKKKFEKLPKK